MDCYRKTNLCSDPTIHYMAEHSLRLTDAQKGLNAETQSHHMHFMLGAPEALQLNSNLMKLMKAKKVLDVGTYTGASALSAALAIPEDGIVYTLDITDEYLKIGRPFWKEAGVENKIKLILGKAMDTLDNLSEGHAGTFDFAFIDCDKPSYPLIYEKCMTLVRPGGVISIDNTLLAGKVLDDSSPDVRVPGIRALNETIKNDQRIDVSFLETGDGLTLCFKK